MAYSDEPIPMPAPTIPNVSPALAQSARDHFQPYYAEPLTEDDGREIAINTLGPFALFREWRERREAQGPPPPPPPTPTFKPKRRGSSTSTSPQR